MALPIATSGEQIGTQQGGIQMHRADGPDWDGLCERIRTLSGQEARRLPVDILSCLTTALTKVEISVYVEDCIPAVTDAAHAFLLCMGTFSERRTDMKIVAASRRRLIAAIRILEDELRLCEPVAVTR